jgi:3D (Asp-Asp-Asp) domain-containing protein
MATTTRKLEVQVLGDASSLKRTLGQAGASTKRFGTQLNSLEKSGRKLGSVKQHVVGFAAGLVGVAGASAAVKSAVSSTVSLAKETAQLTRLTGLDEKQASRWAETARVRGIEAKQLNMGLITLSRNMRNAADGSGKAVDAFKELGISQEDIAKGDTQAVLFKISDAFQHMENPARRAALLQQLFGRSSQGLLPLLAKGSGALKEQLALYGKYVGVVPVKKALEAAAAQRELNAAMDGIKIAFATNVLPILTKGGLGVAHFIAQLRTGEGAGGKFGDVIGAGLRPIKKLAKDAADGIGHLIDRFGDLRGAGKSVPQTLGALLTESINAIDFGELGHKLGAGISDGFELGDDFAATVSAAVSEGISMAVSNIDGAKVLGGMVDVISEGIDALFSPAFWVQHFGAILSTVTIFIPAGKILKLPGFNVLYRFISKPFFRAVAAVGRGIVKALGHFGAEMGVAFLAELEKVAPRVAQAVLKLVTLSRNELGKVAGIVTGPVRALGRRLVSGFDNAAGAAGRALAKGVGAILGPVTRGAGRLGSAIVGPVREAGQSLSGIVARSVARVLGVLRDGAGTVGRLASRFGNAIKAGIVGAIAGAVSGVRGFVNTIIDVINVLPGVSVHHVGETSAGGHPELGSGGRSKFAHGGPPQKHARGGRVTRPMAIVGEEAPRHAEYVIATNPAYRRRNIGLFAAAGHELGIPGFKSGGVFGKVGGTIKDLAGAVTSTAKGLVGRLPDPGALPAWTRGLGSWLVKRAGAFIKDKATLGLLDGGGGDGKAVGKWKGGNTLTFARRIAKKFGLHVTSGWRSVARNRAVGGVEGSLHTHGTPADPGAVDEVGPIGSMQRALNYVRGLGLKEALMHDVGSGLHLHMGFFRKGGVLSDLRIPGFKKGGKFASTSYGPPWGGIQGTGTTATGINLKNAPHKYIVAVDPSVIPLGSHLKISPNPFGYGGTFLAGDTGGAIKGNRIDFYDWRGRKKQYGWGARTVNVEVADGAAKGGRRGRASKPYTKRLPPIRPPAPLSLPPAPDVGGFSLDAQIEALQGYRDTAESGFEGGDTGGHRARLERIARQPLPYGRSGDKDRRDRIRTARKELRELNKEAQRTKALTKIDLKIKGLEHIQKAREAFTELKSAIGDIVERAGDVFRGRREQAIATGPEAAELAALRAKDKAIERAKELTDADKGLTDAETELAHAQLTQDPKRIKEAQDALQEAHDALDAVRRRQREDDLEETIAAKQEAVDGEVEADKAGLNTQLGNLIKSLADKKIAYKGFVDEVGAILAPLGLVFEGPASIADLFAGGRQIVPPPSFSAPGGPTWQPGFGDVEHWRQMGREAPRPIKPGENSGTPLSLRRTFNEGFYETHPAYQPHYRLAGGTHIPTPLSAISRVGELGPENVLLPRGSRVMSASESKGASGPLVYIEEQHIHQGDEDKANRGLAFQLVSRLGGR